MGGPQSNVEREVKLDVGLGFELPDLNNVLPGVLATARPAAKLQAIYVDTPDLRLMRWGVTLRHRRDAVGGADAESGWTVKLPGAADGVALVRTELTWPGPFGPVPAAVASLVRAQARTARLGAVARLVTNRSRVELRDGSGRKLAEVDDDVVSVMDGRRLAARFREVELEVAADAPEALLPAAMKALTAAGALPGDDRPKVVRAIGPRAALGPDVVVPALDRQSTVAIVVSAAIAGGVTRIIRHDPGVRLGDDPEHVHQARVGTRRLRSDLRTFWRLLDPTWAAAVREELGWLASALGEVRDADVLMGRFQSQIRAFGPSDAKAAAALLRKLAIEREEARSRLLVTLDSDRYLALLDNLACAAGSPPLAASPSQRRNEPSKSGPPAGASAAANGGSTGKPLVAAGLGGAEGAAGSGTQGAAGSGGAQGAAVPEGAGHGPAGLEGAGHGPAGLEGAGQGLAALEGAGHGPAGLEGSGSGAGRPISSGGDGTGRGNGSASDALVAGVPVAVPAAGRHSRAPADLPPKAAAGGAAAGELPTPFPNSGLGERLAIEVLPAVVRRPWRNLRRAVDNLGDDPVDEALHEVRILSKRLRYAAEAVSGVVGRPARDLATAAAGLQAVLGDMQDAVVAEAWLRRHATGGPASQALVAGELITLQRQQQAACRVAWVRPWRVLSRGALRRWLRA